MSEASHDAFVNFLDFITFSFVVKTLAVKNASKIETKCVKIAENISCEFLHKNWPKFCSGLNKVYIFKHCDVLEKMEKKGKCSCNWNINITLTAFSQCLKISEKSHSTLRAKRATFTIDKTLLKMPKMANLSSFETLNLAVKQCFQSGHK